MKPLPTKIISLPLLEGNQIQQFAIYVGTLNAVLCTRLSIAYRRVIDFANYEAGACLAAAFCIAESKRAGAALDYNSGAAFFA